MKKEKATKQKKKRIDWKRTFKNNGYMLGLIIKACPGVAILALISTVLGSVHSFLLNTYLYQYALNALQEGKELKVILITLAEQEMYRNMFEACDGKTVIFISHRLSSATMADRVYMFENGEIIEQGTHSELLAMNAKYADMWHKQADTYADAEEVTA